MGGGGEPPLPLPPWAVMGAPGGLTRQVPGMCVEPRPHLVGSYSPFSGGTTEVQCRREATIAGQGKGVVPVSTHPQLVP